MWPPLDAACWIVCVFVREGFGGAELWGLLGTIADNINAKTNGAGACYGTHVPTWAQEFDERSFEQGPKAHDPSNKKP